MVKPTKLLTILVLFYHTHVEQIRNHLELACLYKRATSWHILEKPNSTITMSALAYTANSQERKKTTQCAHTLSLLSDTMLLAPPLNLCMEPHTQDTLCLYSAWVGFYWTMSRLFVQTCINPNREHKNANKQQQTKSKPRLDQCK